MHIHVNMEFRIKKKRKKKESVQLVRSRLINSFAERLILVKKQSQFAGSSGGKGLEEF